MKLASRAALEEMRASARALVNGIQRVELIASTLFWLRLNERTAPTWC